MKKYLFCLLIWAVYSQAQGIQFEPTINATFAKAKEQKKLVMIECFHPTCPNCIALEPTLKLPELGKFYNQFFVSNKLDLSDAAKVKFLNEKKLYIPSFPMLLFFDANQNLIHAVEAQNSVTDLVSAGEQARNETKRAGNFKKRYEAGEKTIDVLLGLGVYSRIVMDTTSNFKAMNDLYAIYPKEELSSAQSWLITKKAVMDIDNGFATHWFENMPLAADFSTKEGHPDAEKNALSAIIQANLFSPRASKYNIGQVEKIQKYMKLVGAGDYILSNTWQAMVIAAENDNRPDVGTAQLTAITASFKTNPKALIYVAKFVSDNAKNDHYLFEAKSAISMAFSQIKENDYPTKAEYFFELARINSKEKNAVLARQNAELALKNATLAKIDTRRFLDLLKGM